VIQSVGPSSFIPKESTKKEVGRSETIPTPVLQHHLLPVRGCAEMMVKLQLMRSTVTVIRVFLFPKSRPEQHSEFAVVQFCRECCSTILQQSVAKKDR